MAIKMESELKNLSPPENAARPLLKPEPNAAQPEASIEEMEKKYAAYVRDDVYGRMGLGEFSWTERVMLLIGLVLLMPIRVMIGMSVLVVYYVICRICTAFLAGCDDYAHMGGWRRAVTVGTGRFASRVMLFVFGFYRIHVTNPDTGGTVEVNNESDPAEEVVWPGAIVSNHVSYLDILYHMSTSFPSFVAKRSVAELPLVGLISKCLGCVYVQRESKSSDSKGVSGIVNERILEAHQNNAAPKMMLFPEGTTTNGNYILPFKTGAFLAKVPLLPVILRYPYQRFSPAWDSISGVRHVIYLLCQFVNYIEVTHLPVYYPSQQEKDDPKLCADKLRRLMATEGDLILSDIGLPEKRVYHAALNGNNSMPSVLHQKDD